MDDIAREAKERLDESWRYDQDNRREALEDLKFIAGFQWADQLRAERAGRPVITLNRTDQFLRAVANPIRQNMPTLKVVPEDHSSSTQLAEIYNGLLRQIQYQSSAGTVYATALEHAVGCGIGWFRIATQYADEDTWNQEIRIKRIENPLSVYPDPAARELDRSDMEWCLVSEMWPVSAYKARWPKASLSGMTPPSDSASQSQVWWRTGDYIRIAEYWRRTPVQRTLWLLQNGDVVDPATVGEGVAGMMLHSGAVVAQRPAKSWRVEMTLVSGLEQLEETHQWAGRWIPLVPVIGAEVPLERTIYRHGVIRFQREPQQLRNYFMSVAAETIGQAPKAPWLATADQIKNYKQMWDSAGTSARPYLLYSPDRSAATPAPTRQLPPEFPAGLMQMVAAMSDEIKASAGIYDASLGARSNETSGVAIHARKIEGNEATYHHVDNLEHGLEHAGRLLIDLIPKIYDNQRILRIVSDDEQEKFTQVNVQAYSHDGVPHLVNDLSAAKFDIRVTLGPNYTTQRAEAVQLLMEFVKAFPPAGAIAGDIVARNLDVPGAEQLAERLKAVLPPVIKQGEGAPMPPPPDPLADPTTRAEIVLKDAQAAKAYADAEKIRAEIAGMGLLMPEPPLPAPEQVLMPQQQPPPGGPMPPSGGPMPPGAMPPLNRIPPGPTPPEPVSPFGPSPAFE